MKKLVFILFLIISCFSFSRYVNQCRVISRPEQNQFLCRSLETGKVFYFWTPSFDVWRSEFAVGEVYKIWFEDEGFGYEGKTNYDILDWVYLR